MNSVVVPNWEFFHQNITINCIFNTVLKTEYGNGSPIPASKISAFEKIVFTDNQRSESIDYYQESPYRGFYTRNDEVYGSFGVEHYVSYSMPQSLIDLIAGDPSQDYSDTGNVGVRIKSGAASSLYTTIYKGIVEKLIHTDGTVESYKSYIIPSISFPRTTSPIIGDYFYWESSSCTIHYKGTLTPRELHFSGFSLRPVSSTGIFRVRNVSTKYLYNP